MYPQNTADLVVPENITTFECLLKCGENSRCMSIFTNNGQCHHFNGGFVDNTMLLPNPGWTFYNVYTDGCPVRNGYIHNRQHNLCYKLHLGGTRDSYDFMTTCTSEGGELMRITSQEIQDHISAFLADATCHFVVLIQGSDRNSEGTFKFEDGTVMQYFDWYGTEPNNHLGDEDFIFIVPGQGFRWGDGIDVASTVSSFICQIPMT
ncbi:macrophage mannose receptor 1-like [Mizuhopecten yessoensis]|uniref:macrophage mannose receptor 1-like n=1 Tax=Mizuhopecten yessoensis TaxID=6573 RepID=UPI000B45D2F3|nr:macrophage mannose receptor 1-like [Mizuhopecten yessoensis]